MNRVTLCYFYTIEKCYFCALIYRVISFTFLLELFKKNFLLILSFALVGCTKLLGYGFDVSSDYLLEFCLIRTL